MQSIDKFPIEKISNLMNKRFLKFCIVGATGIVVNMGILWYLTEIAGLYYMISSAIGITTSIFTNFLLNDIWTWKDIGGKGINRKFARGIKYYIVCVVGLVINMGILWSFNEILGVNYLISNMFGIFGAVLWNYKMNVRFTWKTGIK